MDKPRIIMLKFGTQSVRDASALASIARDCVALRTLGYSVLIVSSGAIDRGITAHAGNMHALSKPALAGLGSICLWSDWQNAFTPHHLEVVPLLVTHANLAKDGEATAIRTRLLEYFVPENDTIVVANENDLVSAAEIDRMNRGLGENDLLTVHLAAMLGKEVTPEYVYIATAVGGYYTGNPQKDASASLIPRVSFATFPKEKLLPYANPIYAQGGRQNDILAKLSACFEMLQLSVPNTAIGPVSGFLPFVTDRASFVGTHVVL